MMITGNHRVALFYHIVNDKPLASGIKNGISLIHEVYQHNHLYNS